MEQVSSPYFQNFTVKQEPMWDGVQIPPIQFPPAAPAKKKPGRKRKVKEEPVENGESVTVDGKVVKVKQEKITEHLKVRKKYDRFKGMTEEEVLQRTLPDHLTHGLDIVIVGINPGLTAAFVGHHYAGPGNHFWKCLFLSELIPEQLNAYDDYKLKEFGIGFTNIVERTSRGSADLTKKEIKEGGEILKGKIQKYKPKIAVFNGKGIYEVFVGHKNFHIGKQPDHFPDCPDTAIFVMPSSSARFTQLPRAVDKVPFYQALKKYRDYLRGDISHIEESEICFPNLDLKVKVKKEPDTDPNGQSLPKAPAEPKQKKPRARKKIKKEPKEVEGDSNMMPNCMNFQQFQVPNGQGSAMAVQHGASSSLPDFSRAVLQVKSEPYDPFLASFNQSVQNCPTTQQSFQVHFGSQQQQHLQQFHHSQQQHLQHFPQQQQHLPQHNSQQPQGQPQGLLPQGPDPSQRLQHFNDSHQNSQEQQGSPQNWSSFSQNGNNSQPACSQNGSGAQSEAPSPFFPWQYHQNPMHPSISLPSSTTAACFFANSQGNVSMAADRNYGMVSMSGESNQMPHSRANSQNGNMFSGVRVKQEPGEGFPGSQQCNFS
ncbi:uncharacterized protein LOC106178371 [Lingula anatina]|uniref:G/T mismatch-specific thymine DNA glycosylase n=1 Tax=Lingula anatina TaxID=7574 RepID=A0A1S3K2V8_LINAN|nr:uncharacterized protein LOC106178371 [Lingula anatina]|eukprot:XP_013416975.1 uncharacterized protein LOC106178371 [Lingula anatina]